MKKIYLFVCLTALSVNGLAQDAVKPAKARKTITNADLEKFRVEIQKSDPDDETERARRGLPSRAEEQKKREARYKELSDTVQKLRDRNESVERFWRSLADALRVEFAAIDAEISYLNETLRRFPVSQTFYAVNYIPGVYGSAFYPPILPPFQSRPNNAPPPQQVYVSPNASPSSPDRPVGVLRQTPPQSERRRQYPNEYSNNYESNGVLVVPFTTTTPQDVTRENLREKLISLRQTRAGMIARWDALVEQARQNGVVIY